MRRGAGRNGRRPSSSGGANSHGTIANVEKMDRGQHTTGHVSTTECLSMGKRITRPSGFIGRPHRNVSQGLKPWSQRSGSGSYKD